MKYIIATLFAAIATAAAAQTTIQQIGNSTYINSPGGRTTVCQPIGNTIYCN